ncbi:hypothetical protein P153DRAFT_388985 [Dothidotthia symphoricarpi CBS 119687]|uniref:Uncharacterized protein n=1 Tax=Dothidotthia symphoricarpi CBS 119687 TaxID=1392245 RepID=A0A6A6A2L4_9PLEO|nr:uncharacterized protein P153DRAFT_388985 [Dothidotthia symphoricarpi CBS 119687]KAF2126242.1 hypothetical protein P153DRAFT_388985 [Dothidotthia symphoricarpi CBS 119687]
MKYSHTIILVTLLVAIFCILFGWCLAKMCMRGFSAGAMEMQTRRDVEAAQPRGNEAGDVSAFVFVTRQDGCAWLHKFVCARDEDSPRDDRTTTPARLGNGTGVVREEHQLFMVCESGHALEARLHGVTTVCLLARFPSSRNAPDREMECW